MQRLIFAAILAAAVVSFGIATAPARADSDGLTGDKVGHPGGCGEFMYWDEKKGKCVDAR